MRAKRQRNRRMVFGDAVTEQGLHYLILRSALRHSATVGIGRYRAPLRRHPDFSGFDTSFCQEGSVSNLIWLFRKTRFSQPINQVLHIFCAFENGYPFLGAANAVSWI